MPLYLGTDQVHLTGPNEGGLRNGRLIATKTYNFNLSQTNFSSLTPTTSAQNLTLHTTTYTTTAGTSMGCYRIGASYDGIPINASVFDYLIHYDAVINFNYGSNTVASTIHGIRTGYSRQWFIAPYYNHVAATGILNTATNVGSVTGCSYFLLLYQKANNQYANTSTTYGVYPYTGTPVTRTAASGSTSEYLQLNCPGIAMRAHASYCPVECLQLLNPTNTTIQLTWRVYEGSGSAYRDTVAHAFELTAN